MLGLMNFDHIFPEIAADETRSLMVSGGSSQSKLPSDTYMLREFYCVERGCDCRRVILHVVGLDAGRGKTLASISYGFDRKGKEPGPFLDPLNPQSKHADELLNLVSDTALADKSYLARLERHYCSVKEVADDPGHPRHDRLPHDSSGDFEEPETLIREQPKVGRNEQCPCGSGKKYKKCCLGKQEELAQREIEVTTLERRRQELERETARLRAKTVALGEEHARRKDEVTALLKNLSPYAALKHMEKWKETPEDRTAPSDVADMSVEEIQTQVGNMGIDASRGAFLKLTEGRFSAWSISEDWERQASLPLAPRARDFLGLAACELWKRFCADRPSTEMLDDWIELGYDLSEQGKHTEACDRWLEAWAVVRGRLKPEMRTAEQASTVFQGSAAIRSWLSDLDEEVYSLAFDDKRYAVRGADALAEILAAFPDEDEDFKIDLAGDRGELLFLAGRPQQGSRVLLDLIRDFPKTAAGYVRLADCLEREGHKSEAREILDAAVRAGVTDGEDFDLAEKCEELGAGVGDVGQKALTR